MATPSTIQKTDRNIFTLSSSNGSKVQARNSRDFANKRKEFRFHTKSSHINVVAKIFEDPANVFVVIKSVQNKASTATISIYYQQ